MEDFPVDVCISYPDSGGVRQKHYFTSSAALLRTLREWKQLGRQDILLTWGRTRPIAVDEVSRQLLLTEIVCNGVRSTTPDRNHVRPWEAQLLLFGELVSVLGCLAAVVSAVLSLLQAVAGEPFRGTWMLIGSIAGLLYSAAMLVLFRRVRRLSGQ
jgi:hypothetical protein